MEEPTLICMPVKGTPAKNVVKDSLVKKCDECGEDVWVSKASLAHSGGKTIICMTCFFQKAAKEPKGEIKMKGPSEGQLRELDNHSREEG